MDERELLLLGLLKREEMHGYRLSQFLEHQLGSVVPMKRSTAYFLLNKLSQQGLIREESDREGRRPERRVYRLTPDGEAVLSRKAYGTTSAVTRPHTSPTSLDSCSRTSSPQTSATTCSGGVWSRSNTKRTKRTSRLEPTRGPAPFPCYELPCVGPAR